MTELDLIRRDRMSKLSALGPKPPWWRPWKRKAWRTEAWKICTITTRELTLLVDAWVGAAAAVMGDILKEGGPIGDWTNAGDIGDVN